MQFSCIYTQVPLVSDYMKITLLIEQKIWKTALQISYI